VATFRRWWLPAWLRPRNLPPASAPSGAGNASADLPTVTLTAGVTSATGAAAASASGPTVTLSGPAAAGTAGSRLTVDAGGRYLLRDGKPWRAHTAACWFASSNASPSDLATLFAGLKAQGFNSFILESLVYPGVFSGTPNAPGNYNGDLPFTTCISTGGSGNTNFDTSNAPYWNWIKSIIDAADAADLVVVFNLCYFSHWGQGWNDSGGTRPLAQAHNTASSYAACTQFGTDVATLLAGCQNIIWHLVGDDSSTNSATTYTSTQVAALHAMAAAVKAVLPAALFTGEPFFPDERFRSTCSDFNDLTNIDSIYGYGTTSTARTYAAAQGAWSAAPTAPTWLAEPDYEGVDVGAGPATVQRCRKEAWWAFVGGCLAGQNYGTANLWNFQTSGSAWQTALTSTGMQQQAKLHALVDRIRWWTLAPVLNGGTQLLSSNTGAFNTDAYAQSALASDGRLGVVYIPPNGSGSQSVTVDLSQFAAPVNAWWYDPTSGAVARIGVFGNSGTQVMASSGNNASGDNDWVLVMDAAGAPPFLPLPGRLSPAILAR